MYSESDIDGAVTAGVLRPEDAAALRDHVAGLRSLPSVDEEHFRLLTGFNDIFVVIALILLLAALGQIGGSISAGLGGVFVAAAAWPLAVYFTAKRRMALPSILLLLAFVGGVAGALSIFAATMASDASQQTRSMIAAVIALAAGAASYLHWRRFMVPITVAAGAAAAVATVVAIVAAIFPTARDLVWPALFVGGLVVFAVAMWWDMSDRERRTRRSDVAFWLHLAAAPMIAHPVFQMLGIFRSDVSIGMAILVMVLYLAFAFVALAVDRRALLVSSLAYVLYAMYSLFQTAGAVELSAAFTALVIGAALLSLSAFWQPMRRIVVGTLGGVAERLPPVQAVAAT
ncbi:hypothetical protein ASE75_04925 [Sphingomonas sp. Leaf17]|uniref:hypothetical protein n=1 Tax=Sphingomonas sp. Leaf17 TaxID=1735683 RepID=UPI0007008F5E|nr:hypothetical protein [Sphingomonas sp. Leaf17]KQM65602.1 hypothetical protein ASE75_04925 [Sphingomonas sp. Leaf17]